MKGLPLPILVILMMAAGCMPSGPITITTSNQPPTAYIDSISPTEASVGETVAFDGHGTDPDGTVVAYRWRSSIDGALSASASFESSSLAEGEHTIYLKVQDNNGAWSGEVNSTVTVTEEVLALPVIDSFDATPGSIAAGESSTLSWDVSSATTVSIDRGIGSVALSGTRTLSPGATTVYTLTATNESGSVTATAQVMVSGAARADLVVTDVSKYETADGHIVVYTIENQGTVDAGPSAARLYANGKYKDQDSVGSLAPGASAEGLFTGWPYTPATPDMKVVADAEDAVDESNEDNNEKQITFAVEVVYDFVASAPDAVWSSSSVGSAYALAFGGSTDDDRGFACYRSNISMEDGVRHAKVLETHPLWEDDGEIIGEYLIGHEIRPGEHFYAEVGILECPEPQAGDVLFIFGFKPDGAGWQSLSVHDTYDGQIITVDMAFDRQYFGDAADFMLQVQANGTSEQDWAAWVEAKIIR